MQKSKQATLFRSWGGSRRPPMSGNGQNRDNTKPFVHSNLKKLPHTASNVSARQSSEKASTSRYVDLTSGSTDEHNHGKSEEYGFIDLRQLEDFFEDDITVETRQEASQEGVSADDNVPTTSIHNTSILEDISGFDIEAGQQWTYPINYPIRDYQFNIVQKCLFKNTLVCLPTGLGKTFIAAVVMYNFYQWYPAGKVVFMAPTKPLVAQQIEACHNIMGIPQAHLTEMTGNLAPKDRLSHWVSKRVFFMTPQVMQNDITRGACPVDDIRCVVFDEAHKALGNYSYCQVVKELSNCGTVFRVLALSATPGNDLKAVQQVVTNLHISHIELRSDDSFDIQPYTHQRKVELNVVPLEGEILVVKDAFLKVLSGVVGRLAKHGAVYSANPERLSKFGLLQARDTFRQRPPPSGVHPGTIESDFATSISLYHAYDLLVLHGLRSFHQYLTQTFTTGSFSRLRSEIDCHPNLSSLLRDLKFKLSHREETDGPGCINQRGNCPSSNSPTAQFFYGHPKLKKLEEVVVDHFKRCQPSDNDAPTETRVMIFSQYRESVQEIADMFTFHAPLVRVMSFVGHGASGKSTSKGLTQKEQTEVVRKFRDGGYNTLVATCVGEEGLDIGEVDLIVCFDAHKSPIRLVQRMGRTGRKRSGRIVVIVAQGKEEQTYRKSLSNKTSIHKAIRDNCRSLHFFPHAPRMLPRHITPKCVKIHMDVEEFVSSKSSECGGRRKERGKGKQPRLSLGQPSLSKISQRGCLNHRELDEWTQNYSLPDRELRACERAVRECYRPHPLLGLSHLQICRQSRGIQDTQISNRAAQNHNSSTSTTPLNASVIQKYPLNLSKWVRWQTAQTHFKMVGPSEKTKQFIALLDFLDVMHSCEGLGDSYHTEMTAFLNTNDIHDTVAVDEEGVRVCKRRRLLSDSSDDSDFREDGIGKDDPVQEGNGHHEIETSVLRQPDPEEEDSPSPVRDPLCLSSDKENVLASQYAIPRPPSCESLDWLDTIEPSQVSTPLPAPSTTKSHSAHPSQDFQFTVPKTPFSSRKNKTPFITPLTSHTSPTDVPSHSPSQTSNVPSHSPSQTSNVPGQSSSNMMDSVDMFNDISSAVLFDDFSDVSTSHVTHNELVIVDPFQQELEENEVCMTRKRCEQSVHWDLNVTSIPESDDEGEIKDGERAREVCEITEKSPLSSEPGTSGISEDSIIGDCRRKRAKYARPDFLLTQAPPSSPPISPVSHTAQRLLSTDYDDDDLTSGPLTRRPLRSYKEDRESKKIVRNTRHFTEEFLDEEAELSGDAGVESGEDEVAGEGEGDDGYDMDDSFINDKSVLTQITPSQLTGRRKVRKRSSPVNMADVYRQSLMSPDTMFIDRPPRGRGGNHYRMVLSERHRILKHYMKKVTSGKKRLFHGEREEVSSEDGMGVSCDDGEAAGEGGDGDVMSEGSEAEEVMVNYGEEDKEEIIDSQSIGEPWNWDDDEVIMDQEMRIDHMTQEEIVSPSLLVSIESHSTPPNTPPTCYTLDVEGWLSDDSSCSHDPISPSLLVTNDQLQTTATVAQPTVTESTVAEPTVNEATVIVEVSDGELTDDLILSQLSADTVLSQQQLDNDFYHFSDSSSPSTPETVAGSPTGSLDSIPHAEPTVAESTVIVEISDGEMTDDLILSQLSADTVLSQQQLDNDFGHFSDSSSPSTPETVAGSHTGSLDSIPHAGPESIPDGSKQLTFLTSPQEASSHAQVVSMLRHSHSVCVLVCPLGHSGYMVSNRMIVERRELREVGVAASASKIIGRLCDLSRLYSRMCVILEDDDKKGGKKMWSKPSHYVETAVSRFHSAGVRVLFSQSQTHSAVLLASLGQSEAVQGHSISLTAQHIQTVQAGVVKLLQQIPSMTYLNILYISTAFTSLKQLINSSSDDLRRKVPSLSERKARTLAQFFRHSFNHHLVP